MSKYPIIDGVMTYPDGREVCDRQTVAGRAEYLRRTQEMESRQRNLCPLCGRHIFHAPEFDHEAGRGLSGSHQDDRIEVDGHWQNAAVHGFCNSTKGSKRYEWRGGLYLPVQREQFNRVG